MLFIRGFFARCFPHDDSYGGFVCQAFVQDAAGVNIRGMRRRMFAPGQQRKIIPGHLRRLLAFPPGFISFSGIFCTPFFRVFRYGCGQKRFPSQTGDCSPARDGKRFAFRGDGHLCVIPGSFAPSERIDAAGNFVEPGILFFRSLVDIPSVL